MICTALQEKVRKELLEKMASLREQKQNTGAITRTDSSTPNKQN